jgi:FixJ family two-component response regulator
MDEEGWMNESLAQQLKISERAISSMRNNGEYHGAEAVAKLANLMARDIVDLYLP